MAAIAGRQQERANHCCATGKPPCRVREHDAGWHGMHNGRSNGLKVVGYFDCYGGGQVVVRNRVAYVGHIAPPHGTSIIDVSDPSAPRELAKISIPDGTLSHKVRVENGI